MRAAAPAIGLLLVLATSAFAQEPEVDCQKAETQMDLNICADREYQAADADLNKTYGKAIAAMRETDKELGDIDAAYVGAVEALKKAQRAWIGYRDGQCELAGFEARGGSMEPMLVSGCLAELTRKRTAELKELLEAQGN
ncbi:putative urease-associated protein [Sinorhizobium fredii NGR234]|uniref:Urease-associated protein n=1 Tax=Sinorhizobium fredii (strain NBRC 101917 / NGR234) TaxID=394 RepID=C3MGX3_SINFN|nr:lysozyme inhibitor LprI family protein [Sinorhizobium fredii]ACP26259.1 putative urease-associated protein [Sinorhizobium fredii NGR234]